MTIGTLALLTLTSSLVLIKLAAMALALTLLAKALFPARQAQSAAAMARLLPLNKSTR